MGAVSGARELATMGHTVLGLSGAMTRSPLGAREAEAASGVPVFRLDELMSPATVARCGYQSLGHFTLPDEAWWGDFYAPMQRRIEELRGKYAADAEALAVLDELAEEPEMHRRHSAYYAYEFFVARR